MTQTDMTADQSVVPDSIKKAVSFMQAGAALAVVQGVAGALSELSRPAVVVLELAICAVAAAAWLWVASASQAGRNGARVLGTVFFALSTLGIVQAVAGTLHVNALIVTVDVLSWVAGLGATVLLWQRESTQFFERRRH